MKNQLTFSNNSSENKLTRVWSLVEEEMPFNLSTAINDQTGKTSMQIVPFAVFSGMMRDTRKESRRSEIDYETSERVAKHSLKFREYGDASSSLNIDMVNNAMAAASLGKKAIYVEGFIVPTDGNRLIKEHSWIEIRGKIVDTTWNVMDNFTYVPVLKYPYELLIVRAGCGGNLIPLYSGNKIFSRMMGEKALDLIKKSPDCFLVQQFAVSENIKMLKKYDDRILVMGLMYTPCKPLMLIPKL